jgi:hypothetical protein
VIWELRKIADYFAKDEKFFPEELMRMKAKCVRETITKIVAATDSPELIRLNRTSGIISDQPLISAAFLEMMR